MTSGDDSYCMVPELIIMPLYHKIRIDYLEIRRVVLLFDKFLREALQRVLNDGIKKENMKNSCEFFMNASCDLSLYCLNEYKKEILECSFFDTATQIERIRILSVSFPRYFWRCSYVYDKRPLFDMLFDATGVPADDLFFQFVSFNHSVSVAVLNICANLKVEDDFVLLHIFEKMKDFLRYNKIDT
jgi:hypothetical protein